MFIALIDWIVYQLSFHTIDLANVTYVDATNYTYTLNTMTLTDLLWFLVSLVIWILFLKLFEMVVS